MDFWRTTDALANGLKVFAFPFFAAFGLGAILFWGITIEITGSIFSPSFFNHDAFNLSLIFSLAAALLAIRIKGIQAVRPILLSCGICSMSASIVCFALFLEAVSPTLLALSGNILSGIGSTSILLLWLEALGCVTSRKMVWAYIAAVLFALYLWWGLSSWETSSLWPLVVLPVVSLCALIICYNSPDAIEHRAFLDRSVDAFPTLPQLAKPAFWMSSFAFTAGVFATDGIGTPKAFGMVVIIFTTAIVLALSQKDFGFVTLCRVILPVVAICIGGAPFFAISSFFAPSALQTAKELILALGLTVSCNQAYRLRCSAAYSAGVVLLANALFLELGGIVHRTLLATFPAFLMPTIFIIALCFFSCTLSSYMLLKNDIHPIRLRLIHGERKLPFLPPVRDDIQQEAETGTTADTTVTLKSKGMFSKREQEVVELILLGKNPKEIGDELFISPSTVRAHISNIYGKLRVHNREDAIPLLREIWGD